MSLAPRDDQPTAGETHGEWSMCDEARCSSNALVSLVTILPSEKDDTDATLLLSQLYCRARS